MLLQEGGADAASMLLAAYTPATGTWALEKYGEFWDAVASAHHLGRRGAGRTIAIIDGAFDASIPALRAHGAVDTDEPTSHGTAVALLTLEVAPEATLRLYATSSGGQLTLDRVLEAIDGAIASDADIINLSMGIGLPTADVFSLSDTRVNNAYAPSALAPDDWRRLYDIPGSPLWAAACRARDAGITVIAAGGNQEGCVFVPAAVPGVVAVGFEQVQRSVEGGLLETATSAAPTYSQSHHNDLLLVQPANVLGSSFACPLLSGFAALMQDRGELPAYVASVRRVANASYLMATLDEHSSREEIMATASLFAGALSTVPHPHHSQRDGGECPECALFAAPTYIDFGLFRLNTADYDVAHVLLGAARRFAPRNPYAAANLGVLFGCMASEAKAAGDVPAARDLLGKAVDHMSDAVRLRPAHLPYRRRLAEFQDARQDPIAWTMLR